MRATTFILFFVKFLLLCIAFYLIDAPFIHLRIGDYLGREVHLKIVGYIVQLLLAVLLVTFFSISKKIFKYLFLVFFLVSSVVYRTYFNAVGTPLLFHDLVTLLEARGEIGNAYLAYSSALFDSILMHLPVVIVYFLFPSLKLKWKGTLVVTVLYLTLLAVFTMSLINTQGRGLLGRPGFFQTPVQTIVYAYSVIDGDRVNEDLVPSARPDYSSYILEETGLKTVLMVIDESITWDLIDLNSNLGVTPVLKEFPAENIVNFGKAVSYANCSDISNASIRKFVRYGEEEADLLGEKAVYMWEVAKKAGFTPYLLDTQRDGIDHNYFTQEELEQLNIVKVKGMDDRDVVDEVVKILEASPKDEKHLILLIKKGSHFPYSQNAPEIFTPSMPTSSMNNSTIEEIFNSYRNLAYEQTNSFFEEVLKKLDYKNEVALVYTSDHGQSFKNIRNQATHCNTKNPEITEAVVPLFVMGDTAVMNRPVIQEIAASEKVKSHYLIPAILMDLLGYQAQDISEFTKYHNALDPANKNRFIYKRAVPLFESDADKYEVEDAEVIRLQNQDIQHY